MTYLVIRLTSIGSVAMAAPIIISLSERYPEHDFVVVSNKDLSAAFYGYDNILFHQVERQAFRPGHITRLFKELRSSYNIDMVVDLQNSFRTRLLRNLFRFNKAKVYTIEKGYWDKRLMALRGAKHTTYTIKNEFERYADTFQKAGLVAGDEFTSIPINQPATDALCERFGEKTGRWIGIAPFAKSKSNILPFRVTKEIITKLSATPDTRVFLFGGGRIECEMLRQWSSLYQNVECVAGQIPLEQELELMRQLDLMLCQDSANQHLCALVGLKTISIWCGTHPNMGYAAWKQDPKSRIQIENLACRPCSIHGTNFCRFGNYACQRITADQIIKQMENKEKN